MKTMEDGWYLLCPHCGTLSKEGWRVMMKTVAPYKAVVNDSASNEDDIITFQQVGEGTHDIMSVRHECGFTSFVYGVGEFLVKIQNNKIVDIGTFWEEVWKDEPEVLKDLAKNLGLEIAVPRPPSEDEIKYRV